MKHTNLKKCFVIILLLILVDCAMTGAIGIWREYFWDSVSQKELYKFVVYMGYFVLAALIGCFVSSYGDYVSKYTALVIRRKLTRKAIKIDHTRVEAGAQRIQEDCLMYPQLQLKLLGGILRNIIMFTVFSLIVISQVGSWYLLIPFVYALLGTLIAHRIAKPLIYLNYLNQNLEAKFRQFLTKINYAQVHRNNFNLFKSTKNLNYFQTFYNQITVIFPYIILAPVYFGGKITFGILMQVANSMIELINSMSFFINVFDDYNKYLSCRKRLKELEII